MQLNSNVQVKPVWKVLDPPSLHSALYAELSSVDMYCRHEMSAWMGQSAKQAGRAAENI